MDTAHRLVILRHAKAEPYAASDFDRALSDRGRRDAKAAGAWLAAEGVTADAALVSAAVRAAETFNLVSEAAGWDVVPELDRALYASDEDGVIDAIGATDESVGTLVVVGHNPTMGMLAQLVDDGDGPPDAVDRLVLGYPTSAVTVFALRGSWDRLRPGSATLQAFHVGRG